MYTFRLWYLPFTVIYSIMFESKSMIYKSDCRPGDCWSSFENAERVVYGLLLTSLFFLHVIWFYMLVRRAFKELMGNKK